MQEDKEFQQRIQKIEGLVHKLETIADPNARACAQELMQALMDLHGAGLERMMEIAWQMKEPGNAIIDDFARDELVASLLLLYGLHPLDLETRVQQALDKVRPYLRSHSGQVELLGVKDGAVRLRLESSGKGCGSTTTTLKSAIEEALYEAAPDMTGLEIEEAREQASSPGLVQLKMSANKDGVAAP
jgi:Fe-S cluster biogenesis protein NfuA